MVEVDETYVGGKPRKGKRDQSGDLIVNKRGRGTKKVPVVALVERDGRIRRGLWNTSTPTTSRRPSGRTSTNRPQSRLTN